MLNLGLLISYIEGNLNQGVRGACIPIICGGLMSSKASIHSLNSLFLENLKEFRKVMPEGDSDHLLAVEGAWQDAVAFSEVYESMASELDRLAFDSSVVESPISESQLAQCREDMQIKRRLDSFLRAAIVFGDIVNLRVLQVAFRRYTADLNVNWLSGKESSLATREWVAGLGFVLTKAHSLRIYRNQLVIHFNEYRVLATAWTTGDHRSRRLVPIHFGASLGKIHPVLEEIAVRNSHLPGITSIESDENGRHNVYELLQGLFDNLPPLIGVERNPDRSRVDRWVALGGVKSPTMYEVLDTVVGFGRALVRQVELKGPPPSISSKN